MRTPEGSQRLFVYEHPLCCSTQRRKDVRRGDRPAPLQGAQPAAGEHAGVRIDLSRSDTRGRASLQRGYQM